MLKYLSKTVDACYCDDEKKSKMYTSTLLKSMNISNVFIIIFSSSVQSD